jgi:hypothetical protein
MEAKFRMTGVMSQFIMAVLTAAMSLMLIYSLCWMVQKPVKGVSTLLGLIMVSVGIYMI